MNSNEHPKKRKFIQLCIYYSLRCNSLWVMFKLAESSSWKRGRLPCRSPSSSSLNPCWYTLCQSCQWRKKHSLLPSPGIMSVTHETTLWHYYFRLETKRWRTPWKIVRFENIANKAALRNKFCVTFDYEFSGAPGRRRREFSFSHQIIFSHVKLVFTANRVAGKKTQNILHCCGDRLPQIFASRVHCCSCFDSLIDNWMEI